ncbi:DUF6250 domain-containing protein [Luteolibacter sp. LG18]|uniref:DUF6250 domain-containing protein n=1 Tax=Luteolibacter sp. LG18 TaxID=2819286 RepID=UPI002B2D9FC1|nr:hypothetical protein llg_24280 [Luteolibacter sp. LG18]
MNRLAACIGLALTAAGYGQEEPAKPVTQPEPTTDLSLWAIEQMSGGSVTVHGDALEIIDEGGCTVWYRAPLAAPVEITCDVTVVSKGGPTDRVSDVNVFWMAKDPREPADEPPFSDKHRRSGKFPEYNSLLTYYVGMGGNNNTTTRFRRYDGSAERPLLPEHDLKAPLLTANTTYHLRLVARDGTAEFWSNGARVFQFKDPAPLQRGWFALRTVKSHLLVRNLRIEQRNR